LISGKYEEVGTIRLIDGKVVFSNEKLLEAYGKLYWIDRFYYPSEGIDFLLAFVKYYGRSYGTELYREKDDTWLNNSRHINKRFKE
jgi:hypothetical protein